MNIETLEQSILFTITYFDTFDYPPTFFEVWRYLYRFKTSLEAVMLTLDEMIKHGQIEMRNGFYFLPERSNLVEKRQKKHEISEKFWDRAVLAAKLLSYLPYIKMVSVVNSLTYFNCDKDSDIDLFIVADIPGLPAERVRQVRRAIKEQASVDIVVRSQKDIEASLKGRDWFVQEVFEKGRVLYAR